LKKFSESGQTVRIQSLVYIGP